MYSNIDRSWFSIKENQKNHEKMLPMTMMACSKGYSDCLKVLLANHVKPVPDCIHIAIGSGYIQCVKLLLECDDFDINQPSVTIEPMVTPLVSACVSGQAEVVKLLLNHPKQKIDVNRVSPKVPLPLHAACMKGYADVVEMLLSKGADPTLLDNVGNNAFVCAAFVGNERIVNLLFDYIDAKCKTREEKLKYAQAILTPTTNVSGSNSKITSATCFDIASNYGHINVLKVFQQRCKPYGINLEVPEEAMKTSEKRVEEAKSSAKAERKTKKPEPSSTTTPTIIGVAYENQAQLFEFMK
ncbi:hypothetical protein FDP41_008808 [Naegleria fowleri]|uniref:Uncharacterized protein n=1 Tax=Naegleria fowleri TaxID=5763 RepID=A0A6A5BEA5_NAEFO|nr:uncharacterized protein FDP41_008808 [Naegleria fowleri]KAF0972956.1 hypothetical protein FDP41_008808 [Naegleria fowleri]